MPRPARQASAQRTNGPLRSNAQALLKHSTHAIALTAALFIGLSGCASNKKAVGIRKVDDLVGKVERAHLECELVQERVHSALDALAVVVGPVPAEDPAVAFQQLIQAIELSESQTERLSDTVGPMESAAESVFARWELDLEALSLIHI